MTSKPIKVVLIDDDEEDFLIIKELLSDVRDSRYELLWISNFEQGAEELIRQEADVYLIDYQLNGRTGLELIDSLANYNLTKPMILLTGFGTRELDVRAMEKGVSNFLSKDLLTPDVLERSIRYGVKSAEDQERLRTNERLKAEKEVAERANRSKSLFLANMSHEIRTPLTAILGFTELALNKSVSEEERNNFLQIIKRNGQHLLNLINDILDVSKIEAGKIEVKKEYCDWEQLLNEVLDSFRPAVEAKGIQLKLEKENASTSRCATAPHYLRQILLNLIGNAIKFTKEGEIVIHATCSANASAQKANLVISVKDSGIGISKADTKNLFQPFSQIEARLNRKFGGTGLGLCLSRSLAVALGGRLDLIASEPNVGSTFELSIPVDLM